MVFFGDKFGFSLYHFPWSNCAEYGRRWGWGEQWLPHWVGDSVNIRVFFTFFWVQQGARILIYIPKCSEDCMPSTQWFHQSGGFLDPLVWGCSHRPFEQWGYLWYTPRSGRPTRMLQHICVFSFHLMAGFWFVSRGCADLRFAFLLACVSCVLPTFVTVKPQQSICMN